LKSIYKSQPDSDHVAKFQGDRSRELGERVAKQKKHLGQNISPSGKVVPGGLITQQYRMIRLISERSHCDEMTRPIDSM